jgi:hypothetical protein
VLSLTLSNITAEENPHRCDQRPKGQHETNEQPNASTLKETTFTRIADHKGTVSWISFQRKTKPKQNKVKV